MIRVCFFLAGLTLLSGGVTLAETDITKVDGEQNVPSDNDGKTADGPLFDFPISRALGIDVRRSLDNSRIDRPSVYTLAEVSDAGNTTGNTTEAAAAPVVYYDLPLPWEQSASIWR